MDKGATSPDFEGDAWIYLGMKRKSHFILTYEVGKRTQQTCDQFMIKVMGSIELPMPIDPVTFFSDGNRQFYESLKELYVPTCYRYGKLIKYKESGRLVKTEKEWIIGDGSLKEINTSQIENMNGIARGSQSHLVRKTKGFAKKVRRLTKHYGFFQMYRNFMWTDKNGMTPAMKEDLSDMPMTWDIFLHPNYQT